MRPVFLQKPDADDPARLIVPEHAKHLEPSCTPGRMPGLPPLTVYLPYMSWMKYGEYANMKDMYNSSSCPNTPSKTDSSAGEKTQPSKTRPIASLNTPETSAGESKQLSKKELGDSLNTPGKSYPVDGEDSWPITSPSQAIQKPQYLRRTLDQFYYPALDDTSDRDKDQTISKWTGTPLKQNGRDKAATDSAMIMVDQFWCWIIDEKTIMTSFPSGIFSASFPGVEDLYRSITKSMSRDPEQLRTVEDMYLLLVEEVAGYMFSQVNRSVIDVVDIYRWATGKKAATQTTYFQIFQKGYASGGHNKTIFNNRSDLKLVLEVADIIDELKMIQHLLNTQKDVVESSIKALNTHVLNPPENQVKETIVPLLAQFSSISGEAEHTRTMLFNLLDLKSNAASLAEAQAATTQGKAVMLFTIITVIFLPLSFFTSYFGQNVRELTGDEVNPSTWHLWRVATPITVVVIVLSLIVAYYITQPDSLW
ncbi:unnamed protein product [Alternaria alternata]